MEMQLHLVYKPHFTKILAIFTFWVFMINDLTMAQPIYHDKGVYSKLIEFRLQDRSGSVHLYATDAQIKAAFGEPDSSEAFYYEMDNEDGFIYYYSGTAFYTRGGTLDFVSAFSNVNAKLVLKYQGNELKLGDSEGDVMRFNPKAKFVDGVNTSDNSPVRMSQWFLVSLDGLISERWFTVSLSNGKIDAIYIYEP